MIIIIVLALLFAAFFAVKRHTGPASLAVVAGVAVYAAFSGQLLELGQGLNLGLPDGKLRALLFLILAVLFPMILYFKSSSGVMSGLLRIGEAALLAILITSLLAPHLAEWFSFDDLSNQIMNWINSVIGWVMTIGIGTAYLDILFYR